MYDSEVWAFVCNWLVMVLPEDHRISFGEGGERGIWGLYMPLVRFSSISFRACLRGLLKPGFRIVGLCDMGFCKN